MIRLILCLQQTGEIDNLTASWGKVLWLCCVQVPRCCWCKATLRQGYTYKLSGAVAKPVSINLWKLVVSPTGSINLGFILRETCCCAHHTFLLGFPTGCLLRTIKHFSGAVAGEKEDFCKGSLSLPTFYFVIVLLTFFTLFFCIFLSKIQKN
jgi:hypothetical protein